MSRTIQHTFFIPQSPEVVWEYLTDSELLSQWLMKNSFKPELGYEFQFHTKPMPKVGFDGIVYCKVIELNKPHKLSYTWVGGMPGKKPNLDSVVTWTLKAIEGGTELYLEHAGFRGVKNLIGYLAMNSGWKKIGKRIQELIENQSHGNSAT
ncbi:SRPBCC domain-containing protein [Jiulongibacter sediminis]|jgi:uncharacterized protein YndB with AHSA1/START domain|uniref:SRPBCC family protein n=1 Tax=Jiulongibacter sediminis TaxID=1605367 RepID=UPI0026EC5AA8|nr:SRPBCC domain-containing protein [Jiulongibacter sediminis]